MTHFTVKYDFTVKYKIFKLFLVAAVKNNFARQSRTMFPSLEIYLIIIREVFKTDNTNCPGGMYFLIFPWGGIMMREWPNTTLSQDVLAHEISIGLRPQEIR